jgi:hypothetical protein
MRKKFLEILIVTAITDRIRKQNHLTLLSLNGILSREFQIQTWITGSRQSDKRIDGQIFYAGLHTDRKTGRHTDRETDKPASRHTDRLAVIQKGLQTD